MLTRLVLVLFAGLLVIGCFAGDDDDGSNWPGYVTVLDVVTNGQASFTGNLSEGQSFDLDFADDSSMACFPATENLNFKGSHVVFAAYQPPKSELTATVTPLTPGLDVNIYAYQIGTTYYYTPANVSTAVTCEAGYNAQTDSNPDAPESVMVNAITNPYNVVIVVAGPEGVTSGEFTLTLDLVK